MRSTLASLTALYEPDPILAYSSFFTVPAGLNPFDADNPLCGSVPAFGFWSSMPVEDQNAIADISANNDKFRQTLVLNFKCPDESQGSVTTYYTFLMADVANNGYDYRRYKNKAPGQSYEASESYVIKYSVYEQASKQIVSVYDQVLEDELMLQFQVSGLNHLG